jgi:cobalt-zinc-cadmium efflux system protein
MHDHSHAGPSSADRAGAARALRLALALTATFTVAEVVGGLLTGSLALLADAGHMLSDSFSLAVALFAIWIAARPPTPQRSFGYQRAEVLAALFNGVALVVVGALVVWGAIGRLSDPPEVLGGPMLAVALGGVAVNLIALRLLSGEGGGMNVRAAALHVAADLAGSIGAVIAAAIVVTTGWEAADPLIAGLIGLLIAASAVPIIRNASRVLLEQAPAGVEAAELGRAMAAVPGIAEVHDLHVWAITSGFNALAAHVLVREGEDCHERRRAVERMLHDRFGIDHTTLQVDHVEQRKLLQVEVDGR